MGTSPGKLIYWLEGLRQVSCALRLFFFFSIGNMGKFLLALVVLTAGEEAANLKGRGLKAWSRHSPQKH